MSKAQVDGKAGKSTCWLEHRAYPGREGVNNFLKGGAIRGVSALKLSIVPVRLENVR